MTSTEKDFFDRIRYHDYIITSNPDDVSLEEWSAVHDELSALFKSAKEARLVTICECCDHERDISAILCDEIYALMNICDGRIVYIKTH